MSRVAVRALGASLALLLPSTAFAQVQKLALDSARGPRALPGRPRSARRGERGGVSWVTLLLLVLVVGGGYLAWVWGPIYFENYAVKQVVRDYMNQAIKNHDDEGLRDDTFRGLAERAAHDVAAAAR